MFTHVTTHVLAGYAKRNLFRRNFSPFVTSRTAFGASGWSDTASRDFHPVNHDAFQGIHNNLVENAIRPTAIGKKNWLFIGEAEAGERSAILYTVIENCRRRGIDPYAYLRDVLTRLPRMTNRKIADVTPALWKPAPPQAKSAQSTS